MKLLPPLLLCLSSCVPELMERASTVDSPRVLAIIAEPPEAKPGDTVQFRVLVASPSGTITEPQAYWALCLTPKPPAEENAVAEACWARDYRPVGGPAASLDITIPEDACTLFGPALTSADVRPRDADRTGGYYQPVRVAIPELAAFGFARIRCALPNAAAEVTLAYSERYRDNTNPAILAVDAFMEGEDIGLDAVPPGAALELRVKWDAAAKERFVVYDPNAQSLEEMDEEMRVSWFVTSGALSTDITGEDTTGGTSTVTWTAPQAEGFVSIWIVLRDSRGGGDFLELPVTLGGG